MNIITFVTGNEQKFKRVKQWVEELDPSIRIEQADLEIPEYQSLDLHEVAHGKALAAWRIVQKPVIIDDGGLFLERFNNFPGTLSKFVYQGIGLDGLWLLAQKDPRASFRMCLAYMENADECHFFDGITPGRVIEPRHPVKNKIMPYTEIFIPEGYEQTYAELGYEGEARKIYHRYRSVEKLVAWLQGRKKK